MSEIKIRTEIQLGDIELIIKRHRVLYENEFGFNSEFGNYVATTLAGKIERLWIAEQSGEFAGCIGLVKISQRVGQLRWLLVEPGTRGNGLGKKLMDELLEYCKNKRYDLVFLWTVNKLPAARKLYEFFDFQLVEEKPESMLWGKLLKEQRWDLSLNANR